MATMTAQILVGAPHPNDGGINPSHYLFLSENSRPAWILVNQNIQAREQGQKPVRIIWIPTVEHMLEDALVMVAIHVMGKPVVLDLAREMTPKLTSDWVELYDDLDEEQREALYRLCRGLVGYPKLILSVFRWSYIAKQLPVLEQYGMDVEVCTVNYFRLSSVWKGYTETGGSLHDMGPGLVDDLL